MKTTIQIDWLTSHVELHLKILPQKVVAGGELSGNQRAADKGKSASTNLLDGFGFFALASDCVDFSFFTGETEAMKFKHHKQIIFPLIYLYIYLKHRYEKNKIQDNTKRPLAGKHGCKQCRFQTIKSMCI